MGWAIKEQFSNSIIGSRGGHLLGGSLGLAWSFKSTTALCRSARKIPRSHAKWPFESIRWIRWNWNWILSCCERLNQPVWGVRAVPFN